MMTIEEWHQKYGQIFEDEILDDVEFVVEGLIIWYHFPENFYKFVDEYYQWMDKYGQYAVTKIVHALNGNPARKDTPKNNILIFTGAGISADSGISTFRDSDGLWEKHSVSEIATSKALEENPELVWQFYRNRYLQYSNTEPNAAHHAITKLQEDLEPLGYDVYVLTQNVDRLHQKANNKNVLELHGNIHDVKCSKCDYIDDSQKHWESESVPTCPECGSHLRPNIVLFGEVPNQDAYWAIMEAEYEFDTMVVIGTSCFVEPAAGMARAISKHTRTVENNLEQRLVGLYPYYEFVQGHAVDVVPKICDDIVKRLSGKI